MSTTLRPYDPARDLESVHRIWVDVGWVDASGSEMDGVEAFVGAGGAWVAEVDGLAECLVSSCEGTIDYTGQRLDLCVITAVTTSWVGRKRGFASQLTATALGEAVESGAAVASLGMFEQGYYDRLGFGSCGYENMLMFDPRSLRVDTPYRTPVRLTADDSAEMHAAMTNRMSHHGAVVVGSPELFWAELSSFEKPLFALGYRTGERLSHFVAGTHKGEHGPYRIRFTAYEDPSQLKELLAMLAALSDQVASVWIVEPAHVQLQDMLDQPGRPRMLGRQAEPYPHHEAGAWQQIRILDLERCVSACAVEGPDVVFNLALRDPLADIAGSSWAGLSGEYTVTLGAQSGIEVGPSPGIPAVSATVNAFSRLWLGVRPASSLAITDELQGDPALLSRLDNALKLPPPKPGWDF